LATYTKAQARDWAREHLHGVHNVIIPTISNDFRDVNEAAARHDVRRDIELGFSGFLAVSETATTHDEYIRFVEWCADEAKGRLKVIFHASFDNLEDNVSLANRAEAAGAELVLLAYPPTFFPQSEKDIYDYTSEFCARTNLGVLLFPVPLWGFERLNPACLSIDMMEQLVDDHPNIVAIKAEGGMPSLAGFTETWNRLGDRVVLSMPLEQQAIPLATILPLKLIATSNSECLGDRVPRMLEMCWEGKYREAMDMFWSCDPARRANELGATGGMHTVHRFVWKYQAWLTGFNGGPLRQPTGRLWASQMQALRKAAAATGVLVDEELTDTDFFVGRNPT
jgi:4-hydroxy-tetrahydrodipicolinate synthase